MQQVHSQTLMHCVQNLYTVPPVILNINMYFHLLTSFYEFKSNYGNCDFYCTWVQAPLWQSIQMLSLYIQSNTNKHVLDNPNINSIRWVYNGATYVLLLDCV